MEQVAISVTGESLRSEQNLLSYLQSTEFLNASTNASRLVSRLKLDIENRQLYQTHQDLRNIYFRLSNCNEKLGALKDLLYNGAIYLLSFNELITGQDIAFLLLHVTSKYIQDISQRDGCREKFAIELSNSSFCYHTKNNSMSLIICHQIASIAVKLPNTELGRPKFIAELLKVLTLKVLNRDLLHYVLAINFWEHKDYVDARYHFLHCATLEYAEDVASLLVEYHSSTGSKKEVDLFVTQFLLQFLCLQCPIDSPKSPGGCGGKQHTINSNLNVCRKTRATIKSITQRILSTYALKHALLHQIEMPFKSLPLLNFTYFIISILDSQPPEYDLFNLLCDIYKTVWTRDPNYQGYLNRIGILYFGLVDQQKQQQRQGGLFNNILMSLFDGADEDEGDDDEESNQSNNMSLCDELD